MRFMIIVKGNADSEVGVMPGEALDRFREVDSAIKM